MKPIQPCQTCTNINCECKSTAMSFFQLLEKVNQRVLSTDFASSDKPICRSDAGIDKLEGLFTHSFATAQLLDNCRENNLSHNTTFLNDKRRYIKIGSGQKCIHFRPSFDNLFISAMISNPNHFQNWHQFYELLEKLIPPEILNGLKITRLDLNLDLDLELNHLLQCLDTKNKKLCAKHISTSGKTSGLELGKGSEQLIIYDRTMKTQDHSQIRSRIELRLRGTKLPCQNIHDVPKAILDSSYFSQLTGFDLDFNTTLNEAQTSKSFEFQALLKSSGFFNAKKHFSQNRNFERDFATIFKLRKWPNQFDSIFKNKIIDFLNRKDSL